MKRKNVFAAFGLLAIVAIMSVVTLSSFSGKDEVKAPVKKFEDVTRYFNGTSWQSNPVEGVTCNANGQFCEAQFDDEDLGRSEALFLADAQSQYAALNYLTNTIINDAVVMVGASSTNDVNKIAVHIYERAQ